MSPMSPRLLRPLARRQAQPVGTPASLLLHFDGNFTDSSGNGVICTPTGEAATTASVSKFGGGSFTSIESGTANRLNVAAPLDLSAGSWTLEFWFMVPEGGAVTQFPIMTTNLAGFPNRAQVDLLFDGGNVHPRFISANNEHHKTTLYFISEQGEYLPIPNPTPYTYGQWEHIAYVNDTDTEEFAMYVGGVKVYASDPVNIEAYESFELGSGDGYEATLNPYYMDDFRLVNGLAVYTGDFVPPSVALAANATPYANYKPYGTLLSSGCDGTDLVGTYANGTGGRYTEVISEGTCE